MEWPKTLMRGDALVIECVNEAYIEMMGGWDPTGLPYIEAFLGLTYRDAWHVCVRVLRTGRPESALVNGGILTVCRLPDDPTRIATMWRRGTMPAPARPTGKLAGQVA